MADTGWLNPGTLADDSTVGTVAWTNPSNASSSNNSYATAQVNAAKRTSHYLKCTNFGASLPVGAVVTGVEVQIEQKASDANEIQDNLCQLVMAGTIGGSSVTYGSTWSTTESYVSRGGNGNLWGNTLAKSDAENSGFGVVISITKPGGDPDVSPIAYIDHIQIKIYYSTGDAALFLASD